MFNWLRGKSSDNLPVKTRNAVLTNGDRVGRYTIVKKLSNGGFGVVYVATRDDGQQVALKEFLPSVIPCRTPGDKGHVSFTDSSDQMRFEKGLTAFFREADMLAQVHNSRIIPIWDVFMANGTAYFAMPVERGGALYDRRKSLPLSESELRDVFVEACKGVEVLHSKGLLHLDLKPHNLWLRPDNSVLILDLGASRWEDEEMQNVQMARTPGFAAPEQHNNKAKGLSVRTDVYALSSSLLTCLMGDTPQSAHLRTAGQSIIFPHLGQSSPELLKIINKGMALLPEMRYKNVAELRHALERAPRLMKTPRWNQSLSKVEWPSPKNHL